MKTPSLSHLNSKDYERVYEPCEDTFLLLDALEADSALIATQHPTLCLEVGSGSGCVSAFVGFLWKHAHFLATDINPYATEATLKTGLLNGVGIDAINSKFAQALLPRLHHAVDLLIFNPPYVVTPSSEVGSSGIAAAWAGGIDGREVLDAFLPSVDLLLSDSGLFYLVTVKENRTTEIMQLMKSHYGLFSKVR
ncbi:HemK methyltransferase member 2 [Physocladia obscura]|uniref:HemK methyltransferase member 2 n=1 Tax=Physocladia obscura TaxID=109957 RepID=A0AAD5XK95_9FUNG|nr:HemK methyltransferase member 2 [Physocladia obscura]